MNLFRSLLALLFCLGGTAWASEAVSGKVIKVLPQFLDLQGRASTAPSLYSRDAYQAWLRAHPEQRSGLRFAIQWKAPRKVMLRLRVEMRGLRGNENTTYAMEQSVMRKGWFSAWADLSVQGENYKKFGQMLAWHVTLWEGNQLLGEKKSFLW